MRVFSASPDELELPEQVSLQNAQIANDPKAERNFWTLVEPPIEESPKPYSSNCPECAGEGFHRQSKISGGEVHELCLWCLGHGELTTRRKIEKVRGGQTEIYTGGQTGQTEGRDERLLIALGIQKVSMNQAAKDEGISITTVRRYVSRFIVNKKLNELDRCQDNRRQFEPGDNWPIHMGGQTGVTQGGQTQKGGVVPVVPKPEEKNCKKNHLEEALSTPRYPNRLVEVQRAHYLFRISNGAAVMESDRVTWKLNKKGLEWTEPGAIGYKYREGVVELSSNDVKTLPGGGRVTLREQKSKNAGRSFIVRLPSNLWPVELLDGGDSIESWVELAARDTGIWLSAELGIHLEFDRLSGKLEYALKTAMPPVVNKLLKGEQEHFEHPDGSNVWTDDSPGDVRSTKKGHYETDSEERVRDLHELAKEISEDAELGDLVMDAHHGRQVVLKSHDNMITRLQRTLLSLMKVVEKNDKREARLADGQATLAQGLAILASAIGKKELDESTEEIKEATEKAQALLNEVDQQSSQKKKKENDDMEVT